jgi:hypothetical protein
MKEKCNHGIDHWNRWNAAKRSTACVGIAILGAFVVFTVYFVTKRAIEHKGAKNENYR